MSAEALRKLDEIEAEMRRVGCWSDSFDQQAACDGGTLKSYLDAPSFELWLQGLFLPNARIAAREGRLPARSQAGEIVRRQYAQRACTYETQKLLALVHEFDALCLQAFRERDA